MEASSLRTAPGRAPLVAGAALLRLKGDEQLVTLVRRGHDGAFEVLFRRYQPRLLAFCRHMLGSTEDAEDVLQESFASAHHAMIADERPIVARAWLYRIARNRCLDHLRRPANADGQDSTDVFERGCGVSSEDLGSSRGAASPTGAARPRRVARAPADGPPRRPFPPSGRPPPPGGQPPPSRGRPSTASRLRSGSQRPAPDGTASPPCGTDRPARPAGHSPEATRPRK